jgi:hypothetical protein
MPEVPANFDLTLVLTAAGATVSAALIASIIEVLKKAPVIGPWIDAKREPGAGVLLSLGLVAYTVAALQLPVDLVSIAGYFVAFLGIAALASKSHDLAATVTNTPSA